VIAGSAEAGRPAAPNVAARALLAAIRGYQLLLSPLFTGSCRFLPSCSDYMAEAVVRYGAVRGAWLGVKRLARCQPFGAAGHDPVPAPDVQPSGRANGRSPHRGCGLEVT
jgi:putative membrane protein insertion efficiency factor